MSAHINVNQNSNPTGKTETNYANLRTSTSGPGVPVRVMNPNDPPYHRHQAAFDSGKLHPNQDRVVGGYHTISSAYGSEPIRLYTTRSCSGSMVSPHGFNVPY